MILSLDYETYSEVDIAKCGSFRYIDDPSFEPLLLAFAFDDDEPTVIDILSGDSIPKDFLDAMQSKDVTKCAWNAAFERAVTQKYFGFYCHPEQWEDSMILAAQCGLPASLKGAGEALDLGEDAAKMKEGKALIRYFCLPCKPTKTNGQRTRNLPEHAPDKWNTFKLYNGQDVVAERAIRNKLIHWKPREEEHQFWCLDAKINEKGIRIDRRLAENAVSMDVQYKAELTERAIALTGLNNPSSVSQIKSWLMDQEGLEVPSLNKKEVADVVASLKTDAAKDFMAIRTELAKSSTAKYDAMLRSVCSDGHVKGCFQFYGANRTGRFAGRLVQLQNLPQNHMESLPYARELVRQGKYEDVKSIYSGVSQPLSELIRTALIPEDGCKIMVADFAAIEARMIAWMSSEQWRLEVFGSGGDIYCTSASKIFGVPVEKHGINGHLRQRGKVAELALGYGGGINAMRTMDTAKALADEPDEYIQNIVDNWREASPHVCGLWKTLEKAAIRCISKGGHVVPKGLEEKIAFDYESGVLWMTLPSGRRIAYWGARYAESKWHPERKVISYMGVDQKTKKWSRLETWGGKLTENAVQAASRDCLREAMFALDREGYDIRAHVHDEVIVSEPIGGRSVEEMSELMGRTIPWAEGLPLRADGYETPFYKKD